MKRRLSRTFGVGKAEMPGGGVRVEGARSLLSTAGSRLIDEGSLIRAQEGGFELEEGEVES